MLHAEMIENSREGVISQTSREIAPTARKYLEAKKQVPVKEVGAWDDPPSDPEGSHDLEDEWGG
eukprot:78271-Pyramimonas_sp.AAC.1